jgi:hypothetical protein
LRVFTRAVESLRLVMGDCGWRTLGRARVALSLFTDFEKASPCFGQGRSRRRAANAVLDQLVAWSGALATVRAKRPKPSANREAHVT